MFLPPLGLRVLFVPTADTGRPCAGGLCHRVPSELGVRDGVSRDVTGARSPSAPGLLRQPRWGSCVIPSAWQRPTGGHSVEHRSQVRRHWRVADGFDLQVAEGAFGLRASIGPPQQQCRDGAGLPQADQTSAPARSDGDGPDLQQDRCGTVVTQLVTQNVRGQVRHTRNWPLTC
jgi:hypothetical protein